MDRKRLEATATYLAVVLLASLVMLSIIGAADGVFKWDILPPLLDKIAVWIMASLFIMLGAAVLVSVMLNISIIATKVAEIADRLPRE
jgi:hypothetical protein